MKKLLFRAGLGLATVGVIVGGAAAFSAFEAHVVNVTATIENATTMDTTPLTFGEMFPQEVRIIPTTIGLSESFLSSNNQLANEVDYMIKQKPKCKLVADVAAPQYAQVTEDKDGNFVCPEGYAKLPLLCPYLSKTSTSKNTQDVSIPAFHGPIDLASWTDAVSSVYKATGSLIKGVQESTTWNIDLHTPCFKGQCAQDWASFVTRANPDVADPAAYQADPQNEHQEFGCDLWFEVTGINQNPI